MLKGHYSLQNWQYNNDPCQIMLTNEGSYDYQVTLP